jgi:hypothetical protein
MDMDERLERALIAVARRSAPSLVPSGWRQSGDYPHPLSDLAGALAAHNVLVLIGDLPQELSHQAAVHFKDWADRYVQLYTLLCEALFPSFSRVNAYYADQDWPPVVVLYGAATPVIVALAEYVAPYVVARQYKQPSDVEMRGLVDTVLDELEAGDLPRERYRALCDDGVAVLRQMLSTQVRQLPLTPPAIVMDAVERSLGDTTVAMQPPSLPPDLPETPPPPESLPEETPAEPAEQAGRFDTGDIPIFFDVNRRAEKRRPPVPDLPDFPLDADRS